MPFENDFLTMMPEVVAISPYIGKDAFNRPTYGTAQHYRCRIVGKGISLRRSQSEDMDVIYDVYTDGVPIDLDSMLPIEGALVGVFTVHDKLVLPNDVRWEDQEPQIFAIGRFTDETDFHHYKIQAGFMYHRQSA